MKDVPTGWADVGSEFLDGWRRAFLAEGLQFFQSRLSLLSHLASVCMCVCFVLFTNFNERKIEICGYSNRMDENLTLFLFFLERSILPPSHVQLIELCLALS